MNLQAFPVTWKAFRAVVLGGLGLLYAIGLIISAKAFLLVRVGKEMGPSGDSYPQWTIVHFASAFLFAALAIMQLLPVLRRTYPALHRYFGRVAVCCGVTTSITGAFIPFAVVPPRPPLEQIYITIYFTGVAACLLLGWFAARRHDYVLHRIWMIRAVASAGAVITQRIIFALFALTFGLGHAAGFWIVFVGAFALGWVINVAFAEAWLRWKSLGSRQLVLND